jgi:hypothetical protein
MSDFGEIWEMTCLICGASPQDFVRRAGESDLITIQRHVMEDHDYTQEQLRAQTREQLGDNHYRWTFPDGVAWLEGKKVGTE